MWDKWLASPLTVLSSKLVSWSFGKQKEADVSRKEVEACKMMFNRVGS